MSSPRIVSALKVSILLASVLIAFFNDLREIFSLTVTVDFHQYLLIIPAVAVYSAYRRRGSFKVMALQPWRGRGYSFVAMSLMVAALLIHFNGTYTAYALQFHIAALPIFLLGAILLLYGPAVTRGCLTSILILFFMIPVPPLISTQMGIILSDISASSAFFILQNFIPIKLSKIHFWTSLITTGVTGETITFVVRTLSSGIISLTGWTAFAALLWVMVSASWWKKLTVALVGYPVLLALNILRISLLVLIGRYFGVELVWELTHLTAGIVMAVIAMILIFATVGKMFGFFSALPTTCSRCREALEEKLNYCWNCGRLLSGPPVRMPKAGISIMCAKLGVVVIVVVIILVPILLAPPSVMVASSGDLISSQGKNIMPLALDGWRLESVDRFEDMEHFLGNDAVFLYTYVSSASYDTKIYMWFQMADSPNKFHTWEACYPLQKATVLSEKKEVALLGTVPATMYIFQTHNNRSVDLVLAWMGTGLFHAGDRDISRTFQLTVIADGSDLYRGGLIENRQDAATIETIVRGMCEGVLERWRPTETQQSPYLRDIHREVTQYQPLSLLIVEGLMLAAFAEGGIFPGRRGSTSRLSEEERQIMRAVPLRKEAAPGDAGILRKHYEATGRILDFSKLQSILRKLERLHLIGRKYQGSGDVFKVVWFSYTRRLRIFNISDSSIFILLLGIIQLFNSAIYAAFNYGNTAGIFLRLFVVLMVLGVGIELLKAVIRKMREAYPEEEEE